jgi:hypothetical protein
MDDEGGCCDRGGGAWVSTTERMKIAGKAARYNGIAGDREQGTGNSLPGSLGRRGATVVREKARRR